VSLAPHLPVAAVIEPRPDDVHTVVLHRGLGVVLDRTLQHPHHEPAGVKLINTVGYLHMHTGFFGSWCFPLNSSTY
jgi:hypothetical protein